MQVHSVVRQEWWVVQVQVQVRLAYLRTPAEVVSVLEQEVPMAQWQVVPVHSVVRQEWWEWQVEPVEVHSVVRQERWEGQVEPAPVPVQVRLAYLRTPAAAVSVLEQEVPMAEALSMEVLVCCSVLLPQLNYLNS